MRAAMPTYLRTRWRGVAFGLGGERFFGGGATGVSAVRRVLRLLRSAGEGAGAAAAVVDDARRLARRGNWRVERAGVEPDGPFTALPAAAARVRFLLAEGASCALGAEEVDRVERRMRF